MAPTDLLKPSASHGDQLRRGFAPLPRSLAGYQNVTQGEVRRDDILVHTQGAERVAEWADGLIGHAIAADGYLKTWDYVYAVYRLMPVPRNLHSDQPAKSGPVTMPTDAAARKGFPVATGVVDYFPDALLALAECSKKGNDQHNPGKPLHWDRSKSGDESDALMRHFLARGTVDSDGILHSVKVAWRALALVQKELEARKGS